MFITLSVWCPPYKCTVKALTLYNSAISSVSWSASAVVHCARPDILQVNSDDPPFFGGYVNENFSFWAEHVGLSAEKIYELASNSFQYAFIPNEQRQMLLTGLADQWIKCMGSAPPVGKPYRREPYVHPQGIDWMAKDVIIIRRDNQILWRQSPIIVYSFLQSRRSSKIFTIWFEMKPIIPVYYSSKKLNSSFSLKSSDFVPLAFRDSSLKWSRRGLEPIYVFINAIWVFDQCCHKVALQRILGTRIVHHTALKHEQCAFIGIPYCRI